MMNTQIIRTIRSMHDSVLRRVLLSLSLLLMLVACGEKECIEADDFGFPKLTISANSSTRTVSDDASVTVIPHPSVYGEHIDQYALWHDTGLEFTGGQMIILTREPRLDPGSRDNIRSRWTGWMNAGWERIITDTGDKDWCDFPNGMEFVDWYPMDESRQRYIDNAPCWFHSGVGLYGVITDPDNHKLNEMGETSIRNPPYATFHLGQDCTDHDLGPSRHPGGSSTCNGLYISNGAPSARVAGQLKTAEEGGRIMFKVLDRYYDDNWGEYSIIIKKGAKNPNDGPIEKIIIFVTSRLFGAAQAVYESTVSNSDFKQMVRATLILFIIFTCIAYIYALIPLSQGELVIRLLKFGLVMQLITSDASWEFFNTHFFVLFMDGVNQLICIVLQSALPTPGDCGTASESLSIFDDWLKVFFSDEMTNKLWSMLSGNFFIGIFFIVLFYIIVFVFIVAMAKALVFYLVSVIAMALLISIAPLFIPFILFKLTQTWFKKWINQLASFALQPVIVFAALGFVGTLFMQQLYRILGVRICWETLFTIPVFNIDIKFWTPNVHATTESIYVPPHYAWQETRLPDMPFLDPDLSDNHTTISALEANGATPEMIALAQDGLTRDAVIRDENADDVKRIRDICGANVSGERCSKQTVFFEDIWITALLAFLSYKFYDLVPAIARSIAGVGGTFSDIKGTADKMGKGVGQTFDKTMDAATKGKYMEKKQDAIDRAKGVRDRLTLKRNRRIFQDKIGGAIDKARPSVKIDNMERRGRAARDQWRDNMGAKKFRAGYAIYDGGTEFVKHTITFGMAGDNIFENKAVYGQDRLKGAKKITVYGKDGRPSYQKTQLKGTSAPSKYDLMKLKYKEAFVDDEAKKLAALKEKEEAAEKEIQELDALDQERQLSAAEQQRLEALKEKQEILQAKQEKLAAKLEKAQKTLEGWDKQKEKMQNGATAVKVGLVLSMLNPAVGFAAMAYGAYRMAQARADINDATDGLEVDETDAPIEGPEGLGHGSGGRGGPGGPGGPGDDPDGDLGIRPDPDSALAQARMELEQEDRLSARLGELQQRVDQAKEEAQDAYISRARQQEEELAERELAVEGVTDTGVTDALEEARALEQQRTEQAEQAKQMHMALDSKVMAEYQETMQPRIEEVHAASEALDQANQEKGPDSEEARRAKEELLEKEAALQEVQSAFNAQPLVEQAHMAQADAESLEQERLEAQEKREELESYQSHRTEMRAAFAQELQDLGNTHGLTAEDRAEAIERMEAERVAEVEVEPMSDTMTVTGEPAAEVGLGQPPELAPRREEQDTAFGADGGDEVAGPGADAQEENIRDEDRRRDQEAEKRRKDREQKAKEDAQKRKDAEQRAKEERTANAEAAKKAAKKYSLEGKLASVKSEIQSLQGKDDAASKARLSELRGEKDRIEGEIRDVK